MDTFRFFIPSCIWTDDLGRLFWEEYLLDADLNSVSFVPLQFLLESLVGEDMLYDEWQMQQ